MYGEPVILPAAAGGQQASSISPFAKGNLYAPLFRHSCPGLLSSVSSYIKNEEIYGDNDPADYVYEVVDGAVRTCKLFQDGRRQIVAFYLPGDVFGLETGTAHRLTADAITDTAVHVIRRRNLQTAAENQPQLARSLWNIMAEELCHAENHVLLLGRSTAPERVASFLLEMDRRIGVNGVLDLPMCRRDIGDYLGLTLETVSRVLSQLQSDNILEFSGARQVKIRNRDCLFNLLP